MQIKLLLDDQIAQRLARQIAANTKHGNETRAISNCAGDIPLRRTDTPCWETSTGYAPNSKSRIS